MKRHPILPSQMVALEDGRDTYFYGNGNCAARDIVTPTTRAHERQTMNTHRVLAGPSWRETVRIVNKD